MCGDPGRGFGGGLFINHRTARRRGHGREGHKDQVRGVRRPAEECDKLDKAQISGTEEGIVDGARMSAPVTLSAAESPGVYVLSPVRSQSQGVWVVSLSATCGSATAGAIVPIGAGIGGAGFLRERIQVFPRPATKAEIDAALKALKGPGN